VSVTMLQSRTSYKYLAGTRGMHVITGPGVFVDSLPMSRVSAQFIGVMASRLGSTHLHEPLRSRSGVRRHVITASPIKFYYDIITRYALIYDHWARSKYESQWQILAHHNLNSRKLYNRQSSGQFQPLRRMWFTT
jgi:hypothetical protein